MWAVSTVARRRFSESKFRIIKKPSSVVLYKTRYSGFYKTDLDMILKKLGIRKVIFTGCTTSVCVESTLRDAMFRDYSPILLEDCAAEPIGYDFSRNNHAASLLTIEKSFGWISNSEKFVKALQKEYYNKSQGSGLGLKE